MIFVRFVPFVASLLEISRIAVSLLRYRFSGSVGLRAPAFRPVSAFPGSHLGMSLRPDRRWRRNHSPHNFGGLLEFLKMLLRRGLALCKFHHIRPDKKIAHLRPHRGNFRFPVQRGGDLVRRHFESPNVPSSFKETADDLCRLRVVFFHFSLLPQLLLFENSELTQRGHMRRDRRPRRTFYDVDDRFV